MEEKKTEKAKDDEYVTPKAKADEAVEKPQAKTLSNQKVCPPGPPGTPGTPGEPGTLRVGKTICPFMFGMRSSSRSSQSRINSSRSPSMSIQDPR